MEGLYQTLPYPYLSQTPTTEYSNNTNTTTSNNTGSPSTTPLMMYRPTLERPFSSLDDHSPNNTLNCNTNPLVMAAPTRPKVTTNIWEDEGTLCFQVDAKGICVARREDNDMINGTKLLNVVGMSRGKRDGILKNEKGRVVVKVGAMHLKGVWIPFQRAKELATKFKILDFLYPLFTDDPSVFLCNTSIPTTDMENEKSKLLTSFRPSMDYNNWNKSTHYLHYPQMIHRNNSIHTDSVPKLIHTEEDVYDSSQYDYNTSRPLQSRNSISSLSSHHSYLYPSHDTNPTTDDRLFYSSLEKEKEGPSTPSSWYSPETPTAVLYQQKKRKSSLSSDDLNQKMLPCANAKK
ncbi:hypothetical protein CU098_003582, partial [Rhizopus stolonifer]